MGKALAVQILGARLKSFYDPLHCLVKDYADDALQDGVLEFEIHVERDIAAAIGCVFEMPVGFHVFERAIQIFGVDPAILSVQGYAATEPFAEHFEGNHQIRLKHLGLTGCIGAPDPGRRAPWQELRVFGHIRNKVIHLLGCVRQVSCLGMGWHGDPHLQVTLARHVVCCAPKIKGVAMSDRAYVIDEMISAKAIAARIEELCREICQEFGNTDKLVVVGLLRGSFVFIADLVRELDLPIEVDFLEASSYGDAMESSREVRILKDLRGAIEGRDVLVVEDIVDTGHTLNHVTNLLRSRKPSRLKSIALLDKPSRREVDFRSDWIGFEIPDEFVVGYGIDYAQRNRNLPFIGKVRFTED